MGMNSRKMKDRACELAEGYEEARDEAFNEEFRDFLTEIMEIESCDIFTEDMIQGFLDSFTFPEEGEWAMDKALNELEDIADQKYEQMRDERYEDG